MKTKTEPADQLGSYDEMHVAAYDQTYAAIKAACRKAYAASEFAGSFWAATDGVNDAIKQAVKDFLGRDGFRMNPQDGLMKQRAEFKRSIAREIRERPGRDYIEIGRRFGLTAGRIGQIATKFKVHRKRGPKLRNG